MTDTRVNLLGLPRPALEDFFAGLGEKPFRARQIMQWIYRQGVGDFERMTDLSLKLRQRLAEVATIAVPEVVTSQNSGDETRKWMLRMYGVNGTAHSRTDLKRHLLRSTAPCMGVTGQIDTARGASVDAQHTNDLIACILVDLNLIGKRNRQIVTKFPESLVVIKRFYMPPALNSQIQGFRTGKLNDSDVIFI